MYSTGLILSVIGKVDTETSFTEHNPIFQTFLSLVFLLYFCICFGCCSFIMPFLFHHYFVYFVTFYYIVLDKLYFIKQFIVLLYVLYIEVH